MELKNSSNNRSNFENSDNEIDVATDKCKVSQLTSADLLSKFGKLVQTERKIIHLVIEYIAEIEKRKLYLEKAYPSIYDFLTKGHGYEEASAMRRISAARVLNQIPEIAPKIESGALGLSQLSAAATGFRQAEKVTGQKLDLDQKKELLSKIEYASYRQTEKIIAQEFNLPIPKHEKQQIHQDDSITLTINFTKEEMAILNQVKDLISHSVLENSWSKVISYLATKEVNQRTKIKRKSPKPKIENSKVTNESAKFQNVETLNSRDADANNLDAETVPTIPTLEGNFTSIHPARKPIAPNVRKVIRERDQCCQHKDPITQKICGSKWLCQVDHIQPVWAGGTNEIKNLQILCAQHNQMKYRKESFQNTESPPNRR